MGRVFPEVVGRYAIYGEIAAGGMASVYFGRLLGPDGFSRAVAIKRLHPHLAKDPSFVAMLRDEARLASTIRHPNVASILDIVAEEGQLCLVMDYVHGVSLSYLVRVLDRHRVPVPIACSVLAGVLQGLHAAHEARGDAGEPLGIVHRDVSPHNIVLGLDGVARLVDFGIAKAAGRLQTTGEGTIKGKFAYMAPEQLSDRPVSRRTDVYAASAVLWELLTGRRLFSAKTQGAVVAKILSGVVEAPIALLPDLPEALNAIVLRGLSTAPEHRFATAREMLKALEKSAPIATTLEVGEWIEQVAGRDLESRAAWLARSGSDESASLTLKQIANGEGTVTDGIVSLTAEPPARALPDTTRRSSRARARIVRTAILAAMLLGVSVVAFIVTRAMRVGSPAAAAAVVAPLPILSASLDVPAPPASEERPAPASAPPLPVDLAPPQAKPVASAAPRPRPPPPRRTSSCNPPYTVDAEGTRRYKLECL